MKQKFKTRTHGTRNQIGTRFPSRSPQALKARLNKINAALDISAGLIAKGKFDAAGKVYEKATKSTDGKIDYNVRELLQSMNSRGFSTLGSCEGHQVREMWNYKGEHFFNENGIWKHGFVSIRASIPVRNELRSILFPLISSKKITWDDRTYRSSIAMITFNGRSRKETDDIIHEMTTLLKESS